MADLNLQIARKGLAKLLDLGAHHKSAIALVRVIGEVVLVVILGGAVIGERADLGGDGGAEQLVL